MDKSQSSAQPHGRSVPRSSGGEREGGWCKTASSLLTSSHSGTFPVLDRALCFSVPVQSSDWLGLRQKSAPRLATTSLLLTASMWLPSCLREIEANRSLSTLTRCGTSSLPQPYLQHCTPWLTETRPEPTSAASPHVPLCKEDVALQLLHGSILNN